MHLPYPHPESCWDKLAQAQRLEPFSGGWTPVGAAGWDMGQSHRNKNHRGGTATVSREIAWLYTSSSLPSSPSTSHWWGQLRSQMTVVSDKYSSRVWSRAAKRLGMEVREDRQRMSQKLNKPNALRYRLLDLIQKPWEKEIYTMPFSLSYLSIFF